MVTIFSLLREVTNCQSGVGCSVFLEFFLWRNWQNLLDQLEVFQRVAIQVAQVIEELVFLGLDSDVTFCFFTRTYWG